MGSWSVRLLVAQSFTPTFPLLASPQKLEGALVPGCRGSCSCKRSGVSSRPLSSPAQVSSLPTDNDALFRTSGDEWVLLNLNVTGYYRVNYDDDNWRKIQTRLQTDRSAIPVINRAQIINDAFNLAR
ncbi:hypothetical protein P7K49_012652 [Saguinus oedipus]|uniref:Aminopeptidase N n=1 Tax=Saguinus oedipus TaxID=9490 RepID=A0ABQ9VE37_SAGOE|nr:hypothetical protein P7K49_012652 [Saguinus oedipus]